MLQPQVPAKEAEYVGSADVPGQASETASSQPVRADMLRTCTLTLTIAGRGAGDRSLQKI